MKVFQTLSASILMASLFLAGCSGNTGPQTNTDEPANEMTNAEISEKAMDNFLAKISEGNYTMDVAGHLKTSAYSKDLVWFDYPDDAYTDFAVMSVKGEVFQGYLEEGSLDEVRFVGEGTALEAASPRLLNHWLDVSEGNIYNLFYNQQDEPLTFVSYEDAVKESLVSFAGYSNNALRLMEEVYLEMDDMDPKEVHVKAVVNEDVVARVNYDDIDIVVTFGDAADNEAAEAWMKSPVYPEARTDWNETDEFVLNSVFLPEYGRAAVPFPAFASYAMALDEENFVMDDTVYLRDSHASEKDMADYIDLLLKEGFSEAEDEDGTKVYRRILREDYRCYSSIELDYDNGVNMAARKFYDFPVYEDLEAVNQFITGLGYNALPESENFTSVRGVDHACEMTESWLYFFDYDAGLYVDADFKDKAEAEAYIKDYEKGLADAGFVAVKGEEDDVEGEEADAERYESEDGTSSFRYMFLDDDTVSMLFKAERYISADEAEQLISAAGFPAIDLSEPITCRDLKRFYKAQYGLDLNAFLSLSQEFETVEAAETFLSAYEERLNDAGYGRVSPEEAGTRKQIAIYNEEEERSVCLDFFEQNGGAFVSFDFRAD